MAFDTLIKGGTVYDGEHAEPTVQDIGIKDGVITALGHLSEQAKETIDADGAIVTPAWIDIHTHYDGQVTWDQEMDPSASHGVGTIVMGNCGVGFAPVQTNGAQDLIDLMEGVEDIPGTALHEGMPWGDWSSYDDYLNLLANREYAINISSLVAHGAIRNFVMGERGRDNLAATEDDLKAMTALVRSALDAGAVGFSTSRILGHRSIQGEPVPGTFANDDEVMAIAEALRQSGKGVFQIIPSSTLGEGREGFREHSSLEDEIGLIAKVSQLSQRPATFTLFQVDDWSDKWREAIDQVKAHNAEGAAIFPQVGSRPTGLVFSLETYHPFMLRPTYRAMAHMDIDVKKRALRNPDVKRAILEESNDPSGVPMGSMEFGIAHAEMNYAQIFELNSQSTYEPTQDESFAHLAQQATETPESFLYDFLVKDGLSMAIMFFTNYTDYSLDAVREMQMDGATVTGLSDAGAHVSLIFDAVNPTYQLTYWARDRSRGETIPLGQVIHRATRRNAQLFGFNDRGHIEVGKKADINVIDFERLSLGDLHIRQDLPAGGKRLMQGANGYVACLINGQVTRRHDMATGCYPGRLIRSE